MSASYEGLIETVPGINLEVLRMDKYEIEKEKDALFRGEFEVVKELVAALTDGDVRIKNLKIDEGLVMILMIWLGCQEGVRQGDWQERPRPQGYRY